MYSDKIKSIWMEESGKEYESLKKDIDVDVAIVGGGMVGILTAYFLLGKRLKIAILEADKILSKTTGNTTAKVTSLHELKYAYLEKQFKHEGAKIYAESNQWAISELGKIIEQEKIECDYMKLSSFAVARSNEGKKQLDDEYAAARKAGLPVSIHERDSELPFQILGELKFENQATFHPRKFLYKIAEFLEKNGVLIFEDSRVIDFENELTTKHAEIKAKKIVIATNYPVYDKAGLFLRMNQSRSYAIAAQLNEKIPDGMYMLIDEEMITVRPYKQNEKQWAIIGGQDHDTGEIQSENPFEKLEEKTRKMFDVKSVDYYWSAQDTMTIDRVPYIGKMPLTENVFVATGFGEWGMTTSFVAAKIIADLINEKENKWADFYSPSRFKPLANPKQTGSLIGHVAKGFGSYVSKMEKFDPEKITPDEGKVMQNGTEKVAVYKDKHNKIHMVSAVCTHKGCIVNFNKHEKSWDCPCHGSRFSVDGKILNSPANKPLKKLNTK